MRQSKRKAELLHSRSGRGPNGEIYGGTSYGGNVFKYVKGKGFTDLGQVWPAKQSVRSLAINKNVLFAGLGSKAELVAWNLTTKKKQSILPAKYHSQTSVLDLKLAGGILFAKVDPDKKILTFDANTFAFLGEFHALPKRFLNYLWTESRFILQRTTTFIARMYLRAERKRLMEHLRERKPFP
ncbi:hypothetical protein RCG23_14445 [Neobacillus sp. PS3-34]|uniref:hypothetical protein n=1 Tax=Neobacillus sp. PS3-34 TaxID=3070678 RepID=UPI0027E11742|nr:hypothetical protein [Neobacillus sp. PS3-34]WML46836.1 hypothetical protein RCG23_14445 [Neobacillus sp. PS3-34]